MTAATDDDRRHFALAFLRAHGADTTPHIFGDLLSHLLGVEALARAWGGFRAAGSRRAGTRNLRHRRLCPVPSRTRASR
jgi:hypothetical protein